MKIEKNVGIGGIVFANGITGDLVCKDNSPPPVAAANAPWSKTRLYP